MLSPAVPYLTVLACWVVYFCWSDINQTVLSLFLLVFAIPLVKLNVNLVVSICVVLNDYYILMVTQSVHMCRWPVVLKVD